MINISRKIIIIFFTFLLVLIFLIISIKGFKTRQSDITQMNILNYIPHNYEFTLISNLKSNDIKNYINNNISQNKRAELNIINESILSYLGFDLQRRIQDIYDNEFAITFIANELKKNDILLIFKIKKNRKISNIINIAEELIQSNQIIELSRFNKLNYISHIYQTKDNYIIATSNKKLIDLSLQSNSNILSRDLIPDYINLKDINLLSISKSFYPKIKENSKSLSSSELITIFNSEDNKIKIRSFSSNLNQINTKTFDNQTDTIQDIIFTNKYSKYKKNINYLFENINQKEFFEEISQKINNTLLYIVNKNNWVFSFEDKLNDKISIDKFNFLKNYKKEDLSLDNITYSIYTNERLFIKDNEITYHKETPIFISKEGKNTYISNDFYALINIMKNTKLSNLDQNNNIDISSYKYIINDFLYIKCISAEQLEKYYKSLKDFHYLINNKLFSLEEININIRQAIPETSETVYLESNLKLL